MTTIAVTATVSGDGWECDVRLSESGRQVGRYTVRVSRAELGALAPSADDPVELVRRSFEYLLEREPPSAILGSFELSTIERYYPGYSRTIRGG